MPETSVITDHDLNHLSNGNNLLQPCNGTHKPASPSINCELENANRAKENKEHCQLIIRVKTNVTKRRFLNIEELSRSLSVFLEEYRLHGLQLDQSNPINGNLGEWERFYAFPRFFPDSKAHVDSFEPFVLQPSLFHANKVPPTIFFRTRLTDDTKPPIGLPPCLHRTFKWKISTITPNSIRNCIAFMKFDTIKPSNTTENHYLGSWCKHMSTFEFNQLETWRKVNHYPGSFHLGRKDKLWQRLKVANQKFPSAFNFHPKTFVLPKDYDDLKNFWDQSQSNLFIMKPPASARGNGVKVINSIDQIPDSALQLPSNEAQTKKSTVIVQQYISNPCLLENGQKFDLRIYVLLTSIDPLRVYVYDEGLVRFASLKYTSQEDGIIDQYMHLTNYFVNKNSGEYQVNNDSESLNGCKWTLKRFWRYLEEHYSVDTDKLWGDINDIILKTIICCEGPIHRLAQSHCKNDYTSYELFGFDIILDESFKPWILEVNITPSLKCESDLDVKVKYQVIRDMFNLVGYNLLPSNQDERHENSNISSNLYFDSRLYREYLAKKDRTKQLKYQKLAKLSTPTGALQVADTNLTPPEGNHNELQKQNNSSLGEDSDHEPLSECDPRVCSKVHSDSILDDLTQSDIRALILSEDELSRCGKFHRLFPSATSHDYLKYFDKPRYYNLLLDAWERRYKDDRRSGIIRLSTQANILD